MTSKTYIKTTKIIFLGVGLAHLLRLLMGWSLVIGGWEAPMWLSMLGVLVAGWLAYNAYTLYTKK